MIARDRWAAPGAAGLLALTLVAWAVSTLSAGPAAERALRHPPEPTARIVVAAGDARSARDLCADLLEDEGGCAARVLSDATAGGERVIVLRLD